MAAQDIEMFVVASASLFMGVLLLLGNPERLGYLGEWVSRIGVARIPLGVLAIAAALGLALPYFVGG